MTDERIKAVFEEYGQLVTGKKYALIRAIAEAVASQRKPLTDEELSDIWFKQSTDWMGFARAIEAAHGIRENT
jgi:hypothetical protein